MNRKILIFTTRQLCYCSAAFFAARLADAFEEMGDHVTCCELEEQTNCGDGADNELSDASVSRLEQFLDNSFDAVIDFDSRLPRMILDDGSYYLDHIHAPFFNYILDHPLYHHATLSCELNHYNVILVDRLQCEYVQRYYPHIETVLWQPLGASEAVCGRRDDQKEKQILFMGTYRNPEQYLEQISQEDDNLSYIMQQAIDLLLEPGQPACVEQALRKVLDDFGGCPEDSAFRIMMNRCYPIELYLRNYRRKQAVDALVTAGLPVTITGDWWDRYPGIEADNVSWQQLVSFAQSYDRIAHMAVLLDSAPFFTAGIHDRVMAGFANRTAVLTENNVVKEGMPLMTYDFIHPQMLVECATDLLINEANRKGIVDKGHEYYLQHGTWGCVAIGLSRQIDLVNQK